MADGVQTLPRVDLADLNGSVKFSFVNGVYNLRFGYAEIAKLQALHGEQFLDRVQEALDKKQVNAVCELLAIASGNDRAKVMQDSPAILPAISALTVAWMVAWRGSAEQTPPDDDPDTEESEGEGKKPKDPRTWWRRLGTWLFGLA
jgi:hypothetical protein